MTRVGLLTILVLLLAAPAAESATTATLSTVILTVQGDADPQTLTVNTDGTTLSVSGPVFSGDPDGAGVNCSLSGDTRSVFCAESAVLTVIAQGGAGEDTITLLRGAEPTYAEGGAGEDRLTFAGAGTGSQATLRGGANDDTLTMNREPVTADAGGGNDTVLAGTGRLSNDDGGPGDDTFVGNPDEPDYFFAEAGADTYRGGTHAATGGEDPGDPRLQFTANDADTVNYEGAAAAVVTLDDQPGDGRAGENDDVGTDIDRIVAGDGADTVTCGTGACEVMGGKEADVLTGGASDDELRGDAGPDVLSGLAGEDELDDGDSTPSTSATPLPPGDADRLDGGAGDDELDTDRGADDLIGGPGTDSLSLFRPVTQPPASPDPPDVVDFTVSLNDVADDGDAGEGDNVHSDIERFDLGPGDDRFTGSAAAEFVDGEDGADTIDPGAGPDLVEAGDDDDTVVAQDGTTDTVRCGDGTDSATLDLPGEQPARADVTTNCETVGGVPFPAVPSPVPSVSPAPDRSAPGLRLGSARVKRKALARTGRVRLAVTCDEACAVRGEMETTRAKVAAVGRLAIGSGRLPSGTGRRTLTVRVAARYRRALRRGLKRRKGLPLVVSVIATDAADNRATRTAKVRVRR